MSDYLLEIGLEEMPAHVVRPSVDQLQTKVAAFLKTAHLDFETISAYATPRRLAVLVHDLALDQPAQAISAKGPAKKIALDQEGNFTKAAIGFARGQGLTPDDLVIKEFKGTEYVYAEKIEPGQKAAQVLLDLNQVILSLSFPTLMHWGSYHLDYIRPIHWLVSLLDDQVVPIKLDELDIVAGKTTYGHRFLGHQLELDTATHYVDKLRADHVLVDLDERQHLISQQIETLAQDHQWVVPVDQDLLEEVTNLVEYPTVFAGEFAKKYLDVPAPVLITSMKDNQRYFYIEDHDGHLLPYFIGVRNGNHEYLDNVIAGNEKVLVARLEDAAFFFNEDRKRPLSYYVNKMAHVTFHKKIGSMTKKMARVKKLAAALADFYQLDANTRQATLRAADIYKFDLVTDMVGEFPELQGTMGEIYARYYGESPATAQAIREHYLPTSSEGDLPTSLSGTLLSLADKLDSIISFFNVDLIPSGSNDPYSLRRQAYGITRMVLAHGWDFDSAKMIELWEQASGLSLLPTTKTLVQEFMNDRLRQIFNLEKIPYDVVNAVLGSRETRLQAIYANGNVLAKHHASDANFKASIEALSRVVRLTAKAPAIISVIDESLFENESEAKLANQVKPLVDYQKLTAEQYYQELIKLVPAINAYFDETMVMVENEKVKQNRLAQMQTLTAIITSFADVTELVVK